MKIVWLACVLALVTAEVAGQVQANPTPPFAKLSAGPKPALENFETVEAYVEAMARWVTADEGRLRASGVPIKLEAETPARYRLFFSPHARADMYLVDTTTGRVWRAVIYTNIEGEPQVWEYQPRIDDASSLVLWSQKQIYKKK